MTDAQWIGAIALGPVVVFVALYCVGSLVDTVRDWLRRRRE